MKVRNWYRVENKADDPTVAEIHIIDFIGDWIDDYYGFGVTAKSFIDLLATLPEAVKAIRVHINSPGGDVFSALTIANALRDQQATKGRTVDTIVDGIAASAASIVMMAGAKIQIADNGIVMIHNPWSVAIGSSADMRKSADTLDTIRNTIIATYKWKSELSNEELASLMDAETWMDADQAIANGLATEKVEGLKAAASLDARALAKMTIPEKFKARVQGLIKPEPAAPKAAAATDVLRECKAGGCLDLAEELLTANATIEQVQARVTAAKDARVKAEARATEITGLCTLAKQPELAAGYIAGAMAVADVKAHLTTITAKLDKAEIDAGLNPDLGVASAAAGWKTAVDRVNRAQGHTGQGARH